MIERDLFGDTAKFKRWVCVGTGSVQCSSVSVLLTTQYGVRASCFKLSEADSADFGYHNEQRERERESKTATETKKRETFFM